MLYKKKIQIKSEGNVFTGKAQKGHLAFEATFESANLGKVDFVQVHLQHISSLSLDAHFLHFFRTRNMTFTFVQTLATQDTGGK